MRKIISILIGVCFVNTSFDAYAGQVGKALEVKVMAYGKLEAAQTFVSRLPTTMGFRCERCSKQLLMAD